MFEPHSFVALNVGALHMNRRTQSGGPHASLDAFLDLQWHPAHESEESASWQAAASLDVVNDVRGGQATLYFCSPACLRAFFSAVVDAFESRIHKHSSRRRTKRSPVRTAPGA